jgi:hypothetical protein
VQWLTPVIIAEIRKIAVGNQPREMIHKTLSQKKTKNKKKKKLS